MDTFNFPYHTLTTEYPESSAKMTFGRGYEFASKPEGPDQVTFVLNFDTMVFYEASGGGANLTKNGTLNMGKLDDFYKDKRLFTKFYYPHQFLGNIVVRFREPLKWTVKKGGFGTVEPFTVKLISQP